jgi:hypothetical protein
VIGTICVLFESKAVEGVWAIFVVSSLLDFKGGIFGGVGLIGDAVGV